MSVRNDKNLFEFNILKLDCMWNFIDIHLLDGVFIHRDFENYPASESIMVVEDVVVNVNNMVNIT